ncbi:hypothetical protein [Caballeronia sp. ATUFL_M2_KS44]|uniref:hypothetical protein n=1 Tax=Caballeronia sp. ATUFL_M2_KS44 TaxID=2921767 RepID=UPI002028B69D|nr:hypothetical protein [Caballeronia sp. ATUFL_M2_KS44]
MWKLLFTIGCTVLTGIFAVTVFAEPEYKVVGGEIEIASHGLHSRKCKLDDKAIYAIESFDKSALIISDTGYVSTKALGECSASGVLHASHISRKLGILSDINLSRRVYVALEFVSVQPYLWLATVARIGSSRNLVSLNGAYRLGELPSEMRRHAFGGSGDAGTSIISPSGRYVSPSGEITCAGDSYPGVWDISKNERVITDQSSCSALFLADKILEQVRN